MTRRSLSIGLVLLVSAQLTHGGNPIALSREGTPLQWDPAEPIEYRLDPGSLGILTHEEAAQLVRDAFAEWANQPMLSLQFVEGELLPFDVTAEHIDEFRFGVENGFTPIVFDHDGSLLEAIGYSLNIIGIGGIEFADPLTGFAVEGAIILNGRAFDGVDDPPNGNIEVSIEKLRTTIVHEIGHLIGLGHADLNGSAFLLDTVEIRGYGKPPESSVETMFSFLTDLGDSLELDDIAMAYALYPNVAFANVGNVSGTIWNGLGEGVSGISVTLRNPDDPFNTAISTISGNQSMMPLFGDSAGTYQLSGVPSGTDFHLVISQPAAGSFSSAVRTTFLNVQGTTVLGLYYGADEFWSEVETELDDPSERKLLQLQPGESFGGADIVLSNIDRLIPVSDPIIPQASGNHSVETAQTIPYPSRVSGVARKGTPGSVTIPASGSRPEDVVEDYYRITFPAGRRVLIALEPTDAAFESDLELYLINPTTQVAFEGSATATPYEYVLFWNRPGAFIIGVSTFDGEGTEDETPYLLTVTETDLPRSALTLETLEAILLARRLLDPNELQAADRNSDGTMDVGDSVLQSQSPATVQPPF